MRVQSSLSIHSRLMLTTHSLYTFAVAFFFYFICCYSAARLLFFSFILYSSTGSSLGNSLCILFKLDDFFFVRFILVYFVLYLLLFFVRFYAVFFYAHRLLVSSPSFVISFSFIVFPFFSSSVLYARTNKWISST